MRRAALLFSILALAALPAAAEGQSAQTTSQSTQSAQKAPAPSYTGAKDQCLNERIQMTSGKPKVSTSTPQTYEQCKKMHCTLAMEKAKQCSCGRVTLLGLDGKVVKTVSKCDPNLQKLIAEGMGGAAGRAFALQSIAQDAVANADLSTPIGRDQAQQVMQAFGIPEEQAKEIVANKPTEAKELLNAFASGDKETIKTAAEGAGVTLNESTLNNIASLSPEDRANRFEQLYREEDLKNIRDLYAAESTFGNAQNSATNGPGSTTGLPTQCGLPGIGGNIIRAESTCGRINYNPLSSVRGPGHFLCPTWNTYVSQVGRGDLSCSCASRGYNGNCAAVMDAQTVAGVLNEHSAAYQQKYGAQCAAAGLSWNSCYYAIHVWGEGGFRGALSLAQSNPGASAFALCNGPLSAAACNNNRSILSKGGSVVGMFGELERRLGGNGNVISTFAQGPSSPFDFSGSARSYTYGGSPFAQVNPVGYSMGYGGGSPTGFGGSGAPVGSAPVGTPTTIGTPSGGATGVGSSLGGTSGGSGAGLVPSGTVTQPTTPPRPKGVAMIIAQPNAVLRGAPIVVAWSSAGVRTDQPCQIFAGDSFLAQGNEGTRKFETKNMAASTTVRFSITCADLSTGIEIRQATTATVR